VVGIVIVSHSASLAASVIELARAMAGPDVALEAAGGLDLPDRPLGTDAALVAAAIERAWSEDGVLVLMDLGSAVLSAEMARDLLDEERRGKVLLCEAPVVEGAVAAAVSARLGASLEEVAAEARRGLAGKAAHLGAGAKGASGGPAVRDGAVEGAGPDGAVELRLRVDNPLGLHARPAARLVQAVSRFDADVRVENLTAARGPVSARSLTAVATLGVRRGDEVLVRASGADAARALAAVRELAAANFGDEEAPGVGPAMAEAPAGGPRTTPVGALAAPGRVEAGPGEVPPPGTVLRGLPASPGLAAGPLRRLEAPPPAVPPQDAADPVAERARLEAALAGVAAEISGLRERVSGAGRPQEAAIFDAHLLLLRDEGILGPALRAIGEGRNAARAWSDACDRAASAWEGLDDPYLRARAADLRAVRDQVLTALGGQGPGAVRGEGVVVAPDLTPAQTVGLDRALVRGVATAAGGPTSHAAILARSLGIPAVVGLGPAILALPEGTRLLLDGARGEVHVDPAPATVEAFQVRAREAARRAEAAALRADQPAVTRDGIRIEVAANIGGPAEAADAARAGADAVGLFRTEFLFLRRDRMPDEDEQEAAYREAAGALDGRPLTIRTLDAGGDKPLPFLPLPPEANPFLGLRGIRLGLARPDLLRPQLRAILRVAADHPVRVLFPMVSTPDELRAARGILEEERVRLGGGAGLPEVGAMVEVPAAAVCARALAAHCDFLSIGTNDLAQYTLAAERGNPGVAALADPLHPAVLALVRDTVRGAAAHGRWVGVCGEAAGEGPAVPLLLGLGVRELSVAVPALAAVKEAVRGLAVEGAARLAERALGAADAAEVRALVGEGAATPVGDG
jgi:phosphocarrier protein FPr